MFDDACRFGNVSLFKDMMNSDIKPDINMLKRACFYGHTEIVKLLLEAGVDPQGKHNWPLRYASYQGYIDIVKLLLSYGADPCYEHDCAIKDAKTREIRNLLICWKHNPDGKKLK